MTENDLELLRDHGLASGSNSFITMISGIKHRVIPGIDIGRILPVLVVSCPHCEQHPSWGKGDSVTEKHWSIDEHNPGNSVGLSLTCFEFALSTTAWMGREYAKDSRLALVRVELSDLLSLQTDPFSSQRGQEQGLSSEHLRQIAPVDLKARKLKVLDLVDQIRLVPEKSFLDAILNRVYESDERQREWHRLLDATQPLTWRQFLAKFAAITQHLGVS